MERQDRWKALGESSDALQAALVEWTSAATPQTLAAVEEAARRYTVGLAHIIGGSAADRHAMSLAAYQRATERLTALKATLRVVPSVDAADTEFLRQVVVDQAAAGEAYEAAGADVVAAVEKARAQEKGRP